jgi:hypothetical protein
LGSSVTGPVIVHYSLPAMADEAKALCTPPDAQLSLNPINSNRTQLFVSKNRTTIKFFLLVVQVSTKSSPSVICVPLLSSSDAVTDSLIDVVFYSLLKLKKKKSFPVTGRRGP